MRALRGAVVLGVLMAAALVGTTTASAAVEAGDDCVASEGEGAYTLVALKRASASALPLFAPVDGVVTGWKVSSAVSFSVIERLRVLRPTSNPDEFLTVGESAEETVSEGVNSFKTRIPVKTGDHFGVFGTFIDVVFCVNTGNPGDEVAYFVGDADPGTIAPYTTTTQVRVPIVAVIEPDADGDGYGDETQDKCPQNASAQGVCPLAPAIEFDTLALPQRNSVLLLVGVNSETTVSVSGKVEWPLAPKAKAVASKVKAVVGLSGGSQTLKPGQLGRFPVKLPGAVMSRLRQLPPKRSLTATLTPSAANQAGQVTRETVTVKLKGLKKARRGK